MKPSSPNQSPNTASSAAADPAQTTADKQASSAALPEGGKILPPSSPVDVPRMPHPAPPPAEQPDLSDAHGHTTSWADSSGADPHKKTARTSINNG